MAGPYGGGLWRAPMAEAYGAEFSMVRSFLWRAPMAGPYGGALWCGVFYGAEFSMAWAYGVGLWRAPMAGLWRPSILKKN